MSKVVAISGGFDPIHVGHLRLIKAAKEIGDELVVILNSDEWLRRKKGYVFMPITHRAELLASIKGVDVVLPAVDDDDTVISTLKMLKPDVFLNAGDRTPDRVPERPVCNELNIEMQWVSLYLDHIHSSQMVRRACEHVNDKRIESLQKQYDELVEHHNIHCTCMSIW